MVWVNIWEHKYNERYDYVESNLVRRYNEKFIDVVEFFRGYDSLIDEVDRTSEGVRIYSESLVRDDNPNNRGTTFHLSCTDRQARELMKIFGGR